MSYTNRKHLQTGVDLDSSLMYITSFISVLIQVGTKNKSFKKEKYLGEKVGTFIGTTTDKVLPAQGGFPVFETSAQTSGKLAGVDVQSMATYSASVQPDGSLYESAQILELLWPVMERLHLEPLVVVR